MNKKANIPITILVIGTIAVCIIALMVFQNHRNKLSSEVAYFRYLEVMSNLKDDMKFSGKNLDYVLEEFYPKTNMVGSRNYRFFVENIKEENNYLVYRKMKEVRYFLFLTKETDEILFEIKVLK